MSAPTTFSWKSGPEAVQVAGSWDSFASKKDLKKQADGSFETSLDLPATTKFTYKYIVDGSWQISPLEPTEDDGQGNVNNFLTTTKAQLQPQSPAPFDNSVPNTPLPKSDPADPKAPQAGAADLTKQSSLGGVAAAAAGGIAGASAGAAGIAAAFVGAATGERSDKATDEQQKTADQAVKQAASGAAAVKEQATSAAESTPQGAQGKFVLLGMRRQRAGWKAGAGLEASRCVIQRRPDILSLHHAPLFPSFLLTLA
ncbi:hypothetical protein IE81DRAFT_7010 [Ceraceosorus guamensis]|uniref:AMP-activated protein kinase glycogen-binding domain-containing protein n=1 Tax=Ceraceosorus guamensis TaxID=1522189 RepID=A0A316WBT6_9BASI|nr:hypothetical protein IE81DRAFT_7010 [Ceraceosorus guamensis]PWN46398.1 hypothetical protein IE81DRAFT_7010 [Ceraceosorus guamensis]